MRTVRFLLAKEFRQIFRDRTMLRMLLVVPIVQLLVLSSAATFEVKEGRLWVVDLDQSQASRGLVERLEGSGRFRIVGTSFGMEPADRALLDRQASGVLRIPADFEMDLRREGVAPVQIVMDAEDGAAAGVLLAYLERVIQDHAIAEGARIRPDLVPAGGLAAAGPPLEIRTRGWYNPELNYHHYMVPGILVVLVTVVAMAIASMNIVREKEIGTLEQLSVTPVTKNQFIASKLLPFWAIALVDLDQSRASRGLVERLEGSGRFLIVGTSFGMEPADRALLDRQASGVLRIPADFEMDLRREGVAPVQIVMDAEDGAAAGVLLAYLFVALGIALWISTVVETQQQAMFIAFSVNMVYLLMSGLFTPLRSMPDWAQAVAQLSPVKHFIQIMRTVLVRGGGWDAVALPLGVLVVYGAVVFGLAVRQFTKRVA